jgi:hypothetical protein
LAAIMRDEKAAPAARAMASNSILDRAYGKPPQTLNANVANRPIRDMTDADLLMIAASEPSEPVDEPGRPGVRKIAARYGVDPSTVQRISRPFFEGASVGV